MLASRSHRPDLPVPKGKIVSVDLLNGDAAAAILLDGGGGAGSSSSRLLLVVVQRDTLPPDGQTGC